MSIDWFTLVAQVINFLILVALLRWLLYAPVLRAIEQRQRGVADRLAEADSARQKAAEERALHEALVQKFKRREEELLREARQDAHQYRERLILEAREDVEQKRAQWLHAFTRQQTELFERVRQDVGAAVADVAHNVLADLADRDLQEQLLATFTKQLKAADLSQIAEEGPEFDGQPRVAAVRTAHALSDHWRKRLTEAVREQLGESPLRVQFETDPALICGVELELAGYRLEWNVAEYLRELNDVFRNEEEPSKETLR